MMFNFFKKKDVEPVEDTVKRVRFWAKQDEINKLPDLPIYYTCSQCGITTTNLDSLIAYKYLVPVDNIWGICYRCKKCINRDKK